MNTGAKITAFHPPKEAAEQSHGVHADGFPGQFDYDEAFSRNIGWLTDWEQQLLRAKRVAIAGMGGVGGIHLQTLTRLGIGAFSIADLDHFELANFNRQAVAGGATLGQPKVDAAARMALDINPQLDLRIFREGVTRDNLDAFLDGVDLYVDSLDFFVLDIRQAIFARCRELGIPAVTAGPIGMGTGYIVFTPDGMSFEEYFRLAEATAERRPIDFLLGLTPAMLHRRYLADGSRVDFANQRGPSTAMACQLCAGVAGVEAVKLLLGRGRIRAAPYYHHFDAYRGRFVVRRLRWGNHGPVQRLKRYLVWRLAGHLARQARPPEEPLPAQATVLDKVLEVARWAPSGDNSQPWRFVITGEREFRIVADLEAGNVYQYRASEPNWLALGMLVEALDLSARDYGCAAQWAIVEHNSAGAEIDVKLAPATTRPDPLSAFIPVRSVDRRPFRLQPLLPRQKRALEAALGDGLSIEWHDGWRDRLRWARLTARATAIRLRIKECFDVHRTVIDWSGPFSRTGLPARATGINPLMQPIMRWALGSYGRMRMLGSTLKGAWLAMLDLDFVPGVMAASFVVIRQKIAAASDLTPEERMIVGQRIMRFWLQATQIGLAFQPNIAAICFAAQATRVIPFTSDSQAVKQARALAQRLERQLGRQSGTAVFMGRIGVPKSLGRDTRSLRLPLKTLVTADHRERPGAPTGDNIKHG